jgi:hypothetical protein
MQRSFTFVLLLVVCLVCLGPLAAQEDTARVRIGYFAFDPREYDTFIDGEIAWFNEGWQHAATWQPPIPAAAMPCCSAIPFMNMPAGIHTFAFAPRGEDFAAALADPVEVTLTPGRVYSLAIIGQPADGSLSVLAIDETAAMEGVDMSETFMSYVVHDIASTPPITLKDWNDYVIDYEGFSATPFQTGESADIQIAVADAPSEVLFEFPSAPAAPGLTDLSVLTGEYPGTWGEQYFWAWNYAYPLPPDVADGGPIDLGDTVSGDVAELASRIRYTLTLGADTALDITMRSTGAATAVRPNWSAGVTSPPFDPMVYVYDASGQMLFWNDESDWNDDASGIFDAGLFGIALPAGDYLIEAAGGTDSMAGPFELTVEAAQ